MRHEGAHILDCSGSKVRHVFEGRKDNCAAVLVPQRLAYVSVGAALNVLNVGNAKATRQDKCDELICLCLCFPPSVNVHGLRRRVVIHINLPVLVHLLCHQRLRKRLLEGLGRNVTRRGHGAGRCGWCHLGLLVRLRYPAKHCDHALEDGLAADRLPGFALGRSRCPNRYVLGRPPRRDRRCAFRRRGLPQYHGGHGLCQGTQLCLPLSCRSRCGHGHCGLCEFKRARRGLQLHDNNQHGHRHNHSQEPGALHLARVAATATVCQMKARESRTQVRQVLVRDFPVP
mmetsp:Transcript_20371/g.32614  ORF Transcript_20371/g.32614 Transcript_20371/m.32614 type:complete len:286 (-) Transcript_20371:31-888(-)